MGLPGIWTCESAMPEAGWFTDSLLISQCALNRGAKDFDRDRPGRDGIAVYENARSPVQFEGHDSIVIISDPTAYVIAIHVLLKARHIEAELLRISGQGRSNVGGVEPNQA